MGPLLKTKRAIQHHPFTALLSSSIRGFADTRTDDSYSCHDAASAAAPEERPVVRVHSGLLQPNTDTMTTTTTTTARMDYTRGWAWQTILLQQRLMQKRAQSHAEPASSPSDVVLLLEHEPVYTLGRGADEKHLTFLNDGNENTSNESDRESCRRARQRLSRKSRGPGSARLSADRTQIEALLLQAAEQHNSSSDDDFPPTFLKAAVDSLCETVMDVSPVKVKACGNDAPIYRVERGGEVTFHGPGMLVVYPIFDLSRTSSSSHDGKQQQYYYYYQKDLHWFLRQTEQVVIDTLKEFGIATARRDTINTGVWCDDKKIAAVGVTASRWITTHGFAINVHPDLSYFDTDKILPCGVEGRGVTSLAKELAAMNNNDAAAAGGDKGRVVVPSVQQVATVVLRNIERIFHVQLQDGEPLR